MRNEEEKAFEQFFETIGSKPTKKDILVENAWSNIYGLTLQFKDLWKGGERFDEFYKWLYDSMIRLSDMSNKLCDEHCEEILNKKQ